MSDRTCEVEGCDKPPRSGKAQWCKKHYHRWYRHGSVNLTAHRTSTTASVGRRYRLLELPGHPLAGKSAKVWEHRAVLFASIGPGTHPCHWCATPVRWEVVRGEGALLVDHVNAIGDDNRLANLVPSCMRCNNTRCAQARADALRDAGWWSSHDTVAGLRAGGRKPRIDSA